MYTITTFKDNIIKLITERHFSTQNIVKHLTPNLA